MNKGKRSATARQSHRPPAIQTTIRAWRRRRNLPSMDILLQRLWDAHDTGDANLIRRRENTWKSGRRKAAIERRRYYNRYPPIFAGTTPPLVGDEPDNDW